MCKNSPEKKIYRLIAILMLRFAFTVKSNATQEIDSKHNIVIHVLRKKILKYT